MRIARILIFFLFGLISIWAFQISVQPFILMANFVNQRLFSVLLGWIPFLGGLIQWLFATAKGQQILAAGLFMLVQAIQIRFWMHQMGFAPVHNPTNLKSLQILTAGAYAVELLISFVTYTPYRGGWEAFTRDIKLGRFETDNIEAQQLIGFALSAVWTETLLWIALTIAATFQPGGGGGRSGGGRSGGGSPFQDMPPGATSQGRNR